MANNNLKAENIRLQEKIRKLEKENKRLKRIIQAVRGFVEANAQFAQQKILSGGLPTGEYHRYEGNLETDNAIASIIGAEQRPILKRRKRLLGWGM